MRSSLRVRLHGPRDVANATPTEPPAGSWEDGHAGTAVVGSRPTGFGSQDLVVE